VIVISFWINDKPKAIEDVQAEEIVIIKDLKVNSN